MEDIYEDRINIFNSDLLNSQTRFSPDCSGKPFAGQSQFFVTVIERPKEAPIAAYKNGLGQKSLECKAGIAPNKYANDSLRTKFVSEIAFDFYTFA